MTVYSDDTLSPYNPYDADYACSHVTTRSSRSAAKTRHGSESSEGVLQVVEPLSVAAADDTITTTVTAAEGKLDSDDVDDDVAGGLEAESEDTIAATAVSSTATAVSGAVEDAPRQEGEVFIPLQDRDFTYVLASNISGSS
jgi:hypothetical protein